MLVENPFNGFTAFYIIEFSYLVPFHFFEDKNVFTAKQFSKDGKHVDLVEIPDGKA